jgi:cytochrome P450
MDFVLLGLISIVSFLLYLIYSLTITTKTKLPSPKGRLPLIGHVLDMLKGAPWNTMTQWSRQLGSLYELTFFSTRYVVITHPLILRQVLQTKQKYFRKDKTAYGPFGCLLGTGLVTAEDELWRRQRVLVSAAFRIEILDEVVQIAKEAALRLSDTLSRLEKEEIAKGKKGVVVDMAEEFRKLTLEVIGQAVLSLSHEESRKIFPMLYLPIVQEANTRVW